MNTCDSALMAFSGCTHADSMEPQMPALFDPHGDTPGWQVRQALAWVAEAQRIIAEQQERILYLETLTTTDELTGLLNRRGFFSQLRRELAHAERDMKAGGLLALIDLDGFKAINDSYGHDAGDAVLCRVAALLSSSVRTQDLVARLGGDEFAVLLTGIDPTTGVCRTVELARRLNTETVPWHGHELSIALSLGTSPYGAGDREDLVVRHADMAMYADKNKRKQAPRRRRTLPPIAPAIGR